MKTFNDITISMKLKRKQDFQTKELKGLKRMRAKLPNMLLVIESASLPGYSCSCSLKSSEYAEDPGSPGSSRNKLSSAAVSAQNLKIGKSEFLPKPVLKSDCQNSYRNGVSSEILAFQ